MDGYVGAFDLAVLLGNWGPLGVGSDVRCLDANGDGMIGAFDLAHLLGNWGPCCGDGLCYDAGEAPGNPGKWESCNSQEFEFICEEDCGECCGDCDCDAAELCGEPFECELDCGGCP